MIGAEKTGGGPRPKPTATSIILRSSDWLVAAVAFVAAKELADWPLRLDEIVGVLGSWAVVLGVAGFLRWRQAPRVWLVELVAGLAVWGAWNWVGLTNPLTAAQFAYSSGWIALTVTGWRWWRQTSEAAGRDPAGEPARVLGLFLTALGVMLPMITSRFVGGTDARWYGYMLHDFIQQWRAHGPPVFIGQGEFAWNGGVHPFRTAPVYMQVAGLWDWVTGGVLATSALQHLTAITGAIAGGLITYAAGVKLAPQRRWEAAGVAFLYVTCPGVLMPLYMADAYMTYMAFAWFALLFYGNVRVLVDGRGWVPLAAGLSLAWMSHPPTAMQATLLTGFLQAGGLAFGPGTWRDWRGAALAALLFAGLSLYYFVGMSELPKPPDEGQRGALLQILGLLLGWFAAARAIALRRGWIWALLFVPAGWLLWSTCRPWLEWLGVTVFLLGLVVGAGRRWNRFEPAAYAPVIMTGCILLAALVMDAVLRRHLTAGQPYPQESPIWRGAWVAHYFHPLTPLVNTDGDFQPGWGLWLAWAAAGLAACRARARGVQLLFGAITLTSVLLLPWPRVGEFLVEYFPVTLRNMTGIAMALRTMPVFAVLLAMGALLALREEQTGSSGWRRWTVGLVTGLAVMWGGWQVSRVVQRGYRATATRELMQKDWRTENAPLDRFVYDLLPIPSYFSHGKSDPRIEVRLLDEKGGVIYGPADMAQAMEAAGARPVRLLARSMGPDKHWLKLQPGFTVEPGEHLLLRFEFEPTRHYDGYLMFFSPHGYREYILPQTGLLRAFGTGPEQSRVLSLWNSGRTAERYYLQVMRAPGNDIEDGEHFAEMVISRFDPSRAAVQVESLSPWRARTRFNTGAWLESPRVFLPGYEATLDGRRVEAGRSPDKLVQVRVPAGEHTVELHYVGTGTLRLAGWTSVAVWCGVIAWACRRKTPTVPGNTREA